jgi:hypothetical protein
MLKKVIPGWIVILCAVSLLITLVVPEENAIGLVEARFTSKVAGCGHVR